jgi:hypothetical protein
VPAPEPAGSLATSGKRVDGLDTYTGASVGIFDESCSGREKCLVPPAFRSARVCNYQPLTLATD